jgi:hypothetical protein
VCAFVQFQYSVTLSNTISKLPEVGAEATKHVGAFVIQFNILIYMCAFVGINK